MREEVKSRSRFITSKLKLLNVISALVGIPLAVFWFPTTTGSRGSLADQIFTALITWVISSFLIFLCFRFFLRLFHARKSLLAFILAPYPLAVSLVFVGLSVFPWLIKSLVYWSNDGYVYLGVYALLCFVPNLLIGLIASAVLLPRLNMGVMIKLIIGGACILVTVVVILYGFASVFVESYTFTPTLGELLVFFDYFWLTFLVAWISWSKWNVLKEKTQSGIEQLIVAARTSYLDKRILNLSLGFVVAYPFSVVAFDSFYLQIVNTLDVFMKFTPLDKLALRIVLGLPAFVIGVGFILFTGIATIRLFLEPTIVRKLHTRPIVGGVLVILWLFLLWWIFFSSTATFISYANPPQFIYANNNLNLPPDFTALFFYTFDVMTGNASDSIQVIGNNAKWLKVWMTMTGLVLLPLLTGLILLSPTWRFIERYGAKQVINENDENETIQKEAAQPPHGGRPGG